MRCRPQRVVLLSALWACACVTTATQSKQAAQDTTPRAPAEASAPVWREMTWAEYYSDVIRNARRRHAIVIWINPPEVRPVDPGVKVAR